MCSLKINLLAQLDIQHNVAVDGIECMQRTYNFLHTYYHEGIRIMLVGIEFVGNNSAYVDIWVDHKKTLNHIKILKDLIMMYKGLKIYITPTHKAAKFLANYFKFDIVDRQKQIYSRVL